MPKIWNTLKSSNGCSAVGVFIALGCMDAELQTLIKECQSTENKGIQFLQTLSNTPLWIRNNAVVRFYRDYCKIVNARNGQFGLAEVIAGNMPIPVVVQGCFRYTASTKITITDQDTMICHIVAAWQNVIRASMKISATAAELIAVRLDKLVYEQAVPAWYYRIQFPYCRIDQEMYPALRQQVLTRLQDTNFFQGLSSVPAGSWDTYLEPGPLRALPMFGSQARPLDLGFVNSGLRVNVVGPPEALELTEIYAEMDLATFEDPEDEEYREPVIQSRDHLIIPEQHSLLKGPPRDFDSPQTNFNLWLPIFLSIYYGHTRTVPQENEPSMVDTPNPTPKTPAAMDDTDIARQCMQMLGPHRGEIFFYYKHIGQALFNITHGSEEGFKMWFEFGQKTGANIKRCQELWSSFEGNWRSVKTIMYYARQDNPPFYQKWHDEWRHEAMSNASNCRHVSIAKALHRTFLLDYACSAVNVNSWYKYENNQWHHIDKAYAFSLAINEEFSKTIDVHQQRLAAEKVNMAGDQKDSQQHKIDQIGKLINKLQDDRFKEGVIRQAANYFYDPHFSNRYDNPPHVICVKSGVIEMEDGDVLFRPGTPEDYLTMGTGVAYDVKLHWGSQSVIRTLDWINQLMVEQGLIHAMQNFLGSLLYGGNLDKKLMVFTGPPDAGKSSFTRTICTALGPYAIKGENGVLYGGKSGDGPSPSMARSRGTRIQFYEELETERGIISSGFIKRATGNDTFFARKLHENGGEIDPLYKTVFVCNLVPQFSTFDQATKERVFILPFGSRWIENAPSDPAQQLATRTFKKDRYFNKHVLEMAKALLWLMVQWYPQYSNEGLTRPPIVTTINDKYWADHDYYYQFKENQIVQYLLPDGKPDTKFWIDVSQAHAEFKIWFKNAFPTYKLPNVRTFQNGMATHLGGEPQNNKWYGWALSGATA